MRNTASRKYEKDYFAPQVMIKAMEWLERNYKLDRFLLWVDSFDPHEPWDPPYPYNRMYNPGYKGEEIIYPEYGKCDYMTEAELKQVRALYAGEVTMLDKWVGYLLDKIEQLGLFENTAIIFTSDHGHYHGNHGAIGKPWAALGEDLGSLYEEMTRIPLLIRLPNGERGKRIDALVQSTDMMPTILDLLEVPAEGMIQGKSLMPLIEGKVERLHSCTFSARYQECISVVNEEGWNLICWPKSLWPRRAELYNLNDDPKQEKNLIDEKEDIAESLRQRLLAFLREVGLEENKVIDYKL